MISLRYLYDIKIRLNSLVKKPMIYVVGGIKGGSGKTTTATNLIVLLSLLGRDVLLIDADDQESATDFTSWRNDRMDGQTGYTAVKLSGMAVRTDGLALAQKYDDVVIDTGGRDTSSQRAALTIADVALFPFGPRSLDIWTIEKLARLIGEMRAANTEMRCCAFINKSDHQGSDNADAAELLRETEEFEFLEPMLGNRKSFATAASEGLSVLELKPADPKAIFEVSRLFEIITGLKAPSTS